jgi:hypothetical protein
MGVNGILEALVTGSIDPVHLEFYRFLLIISTFVYIGVSILFASMGSKGIIIANIISMLFRIIISFY